MGWGVSGGVFEEGPAATSSFAFFSFGASRAFPAASTDCRVVCVGLGIVTVHLLNGWKC